MTPRTATRLGASILALQVVTAFGAIVWGQSLPWMIVAIAFSLGALPAHLLLIRAASTEQAPRR